jgi:hypothetical protein
MDGPKKKKLLNYAKLERLSEMNSLALLAK